MVSQTSLLILVICACAVTLVYAKPVLRTACMKIRNGTTTGGKHYERPAILPQGKSTVELPVPQCVGKTNGIDVLACDDEGIPSVKLIDPNTVVVQRTGSPNSYVVVHITLYCEILQNI